MEKLLIKPLEAAKMLSIGKTTIYELLSEGTIPSIHIGRSIRIPKKALEEWIEKEVE
ncbi:MAG: helix-turn-helix domain-containing protein [bacterium]|nr:helix-turn-helix domain-containing protein [bacterium]